MRDMKPAWDSLLRSLGFAPVDTLYERLNAVLDDSARTERLVEAIDAAIDYSGAFHDERCATERAICQSVAIGHVSKEELRRIVENTPSIAYALARQSEMTIGELTQKESPLSIDELIRGIEMAGPPPHGR